MAAREWGVCEDEYMNEHILWHVHGSPRNVGDAFVSPCQSSGSVGGQRMSCANK
jgi:hypothetical protein